MYTQRSRYDGVELKESVRYVKVARSRDQCEVSVIDIIMKAMLMCNIFQGVINCSCENHGADLWWV